MSKYTTEVRFICETYAGFDTSQGYGKVSEIINNSWNKVFDFNFPMFDETYRSVLCKKILMHYYTREIGLETVGLWKLKLETKMNEIMPYYNKLYQTETYNFNPLYDTDYSKTHEGEDAGNSSDDGSHTGTIGDASSRTANTTENTHGESEGTTWNVYSDTPQGALTNVDNETYLTDARKITDNKEMDEARQRGHTETGSNTRTFNEANSNDREYSSTSEYVEHVVGKMPGKTYASMIIEYRDSLINIDMRIIDELNSLFMLLW